MSEAPSIDNLNQRSGPFVAVITGPSNSGVSTALSDLEQGKFSDLFDDPKDDTLGYGYGFTRLDNSQVLPYITVPEIEPYPTQAGDDVFGNLTNELSMPIRVAEEWKSNLRVYSAFPMGYTLVERLKAIGEIKADEIVVSRPVIISARTHQPQEGVVDDGYNSSLLRNFVDLVFVADHTDTSPSIKGGKLGTLGLGALSKVLSLINSSAGIGRVENIAEGHKVARRIIEAHSEALPHEAILKLCGDREKRTDFMLSVIADRVAQ